MSALRRMRETDRPIAFKPWIYEIAKNACIDQFRRSRRAEEVSYDADEGLGAADYGRLVSTGPTPDVAVDQKMSLDHLCGAFGGLSETHHEILVMRELEGLVLPRDRRAARHEPAVGRVARSSAPAAASPRSTTSSSPASAAGASRRSSPAPTAGALGARDQRRMARHVSYCQPCRRQARLAGLDSSVLVHTPGARRRSPRSCRCRCSSRRWGGGGGNDVSGMRLGPRADGRAVVLAGVGPVDGRLGQGRGHRRDDRPRRRGRRRCHAGRRRQPQQALRPRARRSGDERAGQQHVRDQRAGQDHDGRRKARRRRATRRGSGRSQTTTT